MLREERPSQSQPVKQDEIKQMIQSSVGDSMNTGGALRVKDFSGYDPRSYITWIADFEIESNAKGWNDRQKLQRVPTYLVDSAKEWYLWLTERGSKPAAASWTEFVKIMEKQFLPQDNRSYIMGELERRKQQPYENVTTYVISIRNLCQNLNREMSQEDLIYYIMRGLRDDIHEPLCALNPKTVEELLEKARNIERGQRSHKADRVVNANTLNPNEPNGDEKFDQLLEKFERLTTRMGQIYDKRLNNGNYNGHHEFNGKNSGRNFFRQFSNHTNRLEEHNQQSDGRLNRLPSRDASRSQMRQQNRQFPQKHVLFDERNLNHTRNTSGNIRCFSCGKPGHAAKFCQFRANRTNNMTNPYTVIPKTYQNHVITSSSSSDSEGDETSGLIFIDIKIGEKPLSALIDTASYGSLVSEKLAKELNLPMRITKTRIKAANRMTVEIVGKVPIEFTIKSNPNLRFKESAYVVPDFSFDLLLGNSFNFKHKLNILGSNGRIELQHGDQKVKAPFYTARRFPTSVHAAERVMLKPNQSMDLKVNTAKKFWNKSPKGVISTNNTCLDKHGIYVKKSKTRFCSGLAMINVTNCSNEHHEIFPGTIVANLEKEDNRPTNSLREEYILDFSELTLQDTTPLSDEELEQLDSQMFDLFTLNNWSTDHHNLPHKPFERERTIRNIPTCFKLRPEKDLLITSKDYAESENKTLEQYLKQLEIRDEHQDQDIDRDTLMEGVENEEEKHLKKLSLQDGEVKIGRELNEEQQQQLKTLLLKYTAQINFDITKIGTCDVLEHKIETGDAPPVHQTPYLYPAFQRDLINKQIREMLEMGVITPSRSPWASPVIMVKKKTGEWRMCVDERKVNEVTKGDSYPLPRIEECLGSLSGAKYFTSLDLNAGYWQIKVAEKDQEKTAFITQDGFYEFKKMPFGLKSAPATFQRTMDIVLSGLKYNALILYLDDILIFSSDFETHLENLEQVLIRLKQANLTLKPNKCTFITNSVHFLGHVIDGDGIKMDPAKVKAISEFPTPTNVRAVRSFIGLASYYRKFIDKFSYKIEPLSRLTKKEIIFNWGNEQIEAFNLIKKNCSEYPVLIHFDPNLPTEIRCDACSYGIGAVLTHKTPNGYKVVCYASRLLNQAETNYHTSEKECLAIVYATNKFRQYILGIHFTIVTDHNPLTWLQKKRLLPQRLIRWALHLQEYDYEIIYKAGKLNRDADALSRYPVDGPRYEEDGAENRHVLVAILDPYEALDISKEQQRDKFFGNIYEKIFSKPEDYPDYTIVNKVLHYRITSFSGPKLVVCIPDKLKLQLLYSCHDDPISGHLGAERTYNRIKERSWWPKMRETIKSYVASCQSCQMRKLPTTLKAGLLVPIRIGEPFYIVGIDLLGPFKKSDMGKKYIIVATEYLTKWVECKALINSTAFECAKFFLHRIILRHGSPQKVLSDRGAQFLGDMFQNVLDLVGTKHVKTSYYHPQTNGLTERFNKTLATMLSMYVNTQQSDWDQFLPFVTFAYNTSSHSTTNFSPFVLIHGREPRLPHEVVLKRVTEGITRPDQLSSQVSEFLKSAGQIVKEKLEKGHFKNELEYNKRRKDIEFDIGDDVLIYKPVRKKGKSPKLQMPYIGPFKVHSKTGPINYRMKSPGGKKNKFEDANVVKLKGYKTRSPQCDPVPHPIERFEEAYYELEDVSQTTLEETPNDKSCDNYEGETEIEDKSSSTDESSGSEIEIEDIVPNEENTPPAGEIMQTLDIVETPTPPNNDATQSTLRRSSRIRQQPDRFSYLTLPFLMLTFLNQTDTSFHKMNPIVWRKTEKPVLVGINQIVAYIKYNDPCTMFENDKKILGDIPVDYLHRVCKDTVEKDFIQPLLKFCQTPKEEAHNVTLKREKRIVLTGLIIGAIAIVGVITVGTSAVSMGMALKNTDSINEIQNHRKILERKISILMDNELRQKEIALVLSQDIMDLSKKVDTLLGDLEMLKKFLPQGQYQIINWAIRSALTREKLHRVGEMWNDGKVNGELLEILNISLPCKLNCPMKFAEARGCQLDQTQNTITLRFDAKTINLNATVLHGDAFTLFSTPDNNSTACFLNYVGPREVVYDKSQDCVSIITKNMKLVSNLIFSPSTAKCKRLPQANITRKYWRQDGCEDSNLLTEEDRIQVKQLLNKNYIYCKTWEIEVYQRNVTCPDYVFSLPNDVPFRIGHIEYKVQHMTFDNIQYNLIPDYSQRINFDLMPHLQDSIIMEHELEVQKKIAQIHNFEIGLLDETDANIIYPYIYLVSTVIIISIISGGIWYTIRTKKQFCHKEKREEKVGDKSKEEIIEAKSGSDQGKESEEATTQNHGQGQEASNVIHVI